MHLPTVLWYIGASKIVDILPLNVHVALVAADGHTIAVCKLRVHQCSISTLHISTLHEDASSCSLLWYKSTNRL